MSALPPGSSFGDGGSLAGIPPSDGGDPGYPGPWTTGEPREGLRDDGQARIVCLIPSVNLTPVGGEMVPVPYMIYDTCDHMENYSEKTFHTGKKVLRFCSRTSHVHGDEAGTGGGVVSGTVGADCEPIDRAPKVLVEKSEVVRHLDTFYMENRNTIGEALFVRDMTLYSPPADTDPLPGSLRLASATTQSSTVAQVTVEAAASVSLAGRIWSGTKLAAVGAEVVGLGPEDPAADLAAGIILGVGGMVALGAMLFDRRTYQEEQLKQTTSSSSQRQAEPPPDPDSALRKIIKTVAAAAILVEGARITAQGDSDDKRKCIVGKYKDIQGLCGDKGQAHHIVPDYTLRYGNRSQGKAGINRIPKLPDFWNGAAICLNGQAGMEDSEHGEAHLADKRIAELGKKGIPPDTAPIGEIRAAAEAAVKLVRPDCAVQIMAATKEMFVDVDLRRLGRTLKNPLPAGDTLEALTEGKIQSGGNVE